MADYTYKQKLAESEDASLRLILESVYRDFFPPHSVERVEYDSSAEFQAGGRDVRITLKAPRGRAYIQTIEEKLRSPRDQVLAILDAYYQLNAPPGKLAHIRRIGQQLTAIIEHPDTPQIIFELLTDFWFELRNQSDRPITPERIAAEMREGWPALADVLGEES